MRKSTITLGDAQGWDSNRNSNSSGHSAHLSDVLSHDVTCEGNGLTLTGRGSTTDYTNVLCVFS
jgi:hypothetical protein